MNTPRVRGVLVMDSEGGRIAVKYFGCFPNHADQLAFEERLFKKTQKTSARVDADIIPFEGMTVIYKFTADVFTYWLCDDNENELILLSCQAALEEALSNLLRGQVGKRMVVENLDLLLLCIDEIVDEGLILETDATQIIQRAAMKVQGDGSDVPIAEKTLTQAMQAARQQFFRSIR